MFLRQLMKVCSFIFDGLLVFILTIPDLLVALFFCFFPRPCKNISKEIVLVTGSGQGIGREMALLFALQGCEVVCVDISAENNEITVKEIIAQGGRARAYVCNVADREAVMKLGKDVGQVDILVNNAGIYPNKSLWNATEEEMRMVIDINLFSQFWTVQAFLPGMKQRNHGHVVCISSMSGLCGLAYVIPYAVSKYGVAGLMASLAKEIHAEKLNIKTTTVYPYFIKTRPEIEKCVELRIPAIATKYAAKDIVRGVQQNLISFTVPRGFVHFMNLCSLLPKSYELRFLDYFPINITDPEEDELKEKVKSGFFKPTGKIVVQKVHN